MLGLLGRGGWGVVVVGRRGREKGKRLVRFIKRLLGGVKRGRRGKLLLLLKQISISLSHPPTQKAKSSS